MELRPQVAVLLAVAGDDVLLARLGQVVRLLQQRSDLGEDRYDPNPLVVVVLRL
ncbi:MAG TPA: hypothetical protein VF624_10600 [Tepidisphaeraceae bacterium]